MRVDFTEKEIKRLEAFCKRRNLTIKKFLAKGHSSRIFLVQKGRQKFVAKVERDDSTRKRMLEKEAFNLGLANSLGIGPKLEAHDLHLRVLLMEFIDGKTFGEWIQEKRTKAEIERFVKALLAQAKKMDEFGLDHGQLAGRGANILVRKGKPVIIDFEKASIARKCHNLNVVEAFLFKNKHSKIVKKIGRFLEK
ncbi:MAG: phosphotransferase [Candidatus Diapherotrites archaeon]